MCSVAGGREHAFVNPSGFLFHVGCFRRAEGCFTTGTPTYEHTWFSGFAWSYAHCGRCQTHLGWFFRGGGEPFFGLILDRIVEAEESGEE